MQDFFQFDDQLFHHEHGLRRVLLHIFVREAFARAGNERESGVSGLSEMIPKVRYPFDAQ
ncbi:MAG: hypothetical protein OXP28_03290 [Gammaproteobacteria bacterium]|nr:hypothetical protein [Gammaproteobacteria bacterium]MDE0224143.1 hypothetical protein [Gammaproteobacteria bacterium]MDE0451187.1 hypothetical protein [Gammaproteobacteria bacterium]